MLSLCWTYIQWPFNGNSQLSRRSEKHHVTTSSNSIIRMGESKGYCFITFANIESANAAPCDGLPIWGCWWMLGLLGCLPCLCNAMVLGISRLDRLEFWDICGGSNSQWNRHTWWTLAWRPSWRGTSQLWEQHCGGQVGGLQTSFVTRLGRTRPEFCDPNFGPEAAKRGWSQGRCALAEMSCSSPVSATRLRQFMSVHSNSC